MTFSVLEALSFFLSFFLSLSPFVSSFLFLFSFIRLSKFLLLTCISKSVTFRLQLFKKASDTIN